MRWAWIALGIVAVTTACTTPVSPPPPGSAAFRAAYDDGCAAGYGYAGSPFHANRGGPAAAPPKTEPSRRAGWLSGFDRCRRSYDRVQRAFNNFLGTR